MFVVPPDPMADVASTAVAALALLASSAAVSRIAPDTPSSWFDGFLSGLSFGFFVRQALLHPLLARGAERLLALSFVVWAGCVVIRALRARRQSA